MFDRMNRVCRPLLGAASLLVGAMVAFVPPGAQAQVVANLPTQIGVSATNWYNYSSQRGVPISSTVGTPAGSDGRQSTTNSSLASATVWATTPPTSSQWIGF